MTTQSRHLHRLLSLFDPLFCRPALVIEPYHRPARRLQIGYDDAYSWEQLLSVKLHSRHHAPRRLPTCRLIQKAHVPDHGLVARSSYGPRQLLLPTVGKREFPYSDAVYRTPPSLTAFDPNACSRAPLSTRQRQGADPPNHVSKKPPRQMALRQQQPIVASMFHLAGAKSPPSFP
jgi:hypothetical protein